MSSMRAAKAWGGLALSTALLATIVNAQTSTVASSGLGKGVTLPKTRMYALTSDNSLYAFQAGADEYSRVGRVDVDDGGTLIGIDFRPADGALYGVTDLGGIYTIDLESHHFGRKMKVGRSTKVGAVTTRFSGGLQALVDFNPVANALRIAGSNDQNIAVLNKNGNLNETAAQTNFAYDKGDVNFGKNPEIVGGAYSNNYVGATSTLIYFVDHDLDTLVTISTKNATGSSNIGGGLLQTIGSLFDETGAPVNMSPTSDFDIYGEANGANYLVGQTASVLFSIDLSQIDPKLPMGKTQRVVVRRGKPVPAPDSGTPLSGALFDIAVAPK
jgi:hypothetical protein